MPGLGFLLGAFGFVRRAAQAAFTLATRYPLAPVITVESVFFLGAFASRARFRKRHEKTKMYVIPTDLNSCSPFSGRSKNTHSGHTAKICPPAFLVPHVGCGINGTEVGNSVVIRFAVDVINLIARPFAIYDGPNNPVRKEALSEDMASAIAPALVIERRLSSKSRVPHPEGSVGREHGARTVLPRQCARIGIIDKQLPKCFDGDRIRGSHSAVLSRGGQGRATLTRRFRPAFYGRFTVCSQGAMAA